MGIDIEHLRTWVGREQRSIDMLDVFPARALGAMLDHVELRATGDTLPPAWHWLYFLDTPRTSATGRDGHARTGDFLPPVPLARRMWAAGTLDITRPLHLGVRAEKVSRVCSVDLKHGSTGVLIFVTVEHRIMQNDAVCLHEEQTLVYREMPARADALAPGETMSSLPDRTRAVPIDPVLLFRFSALTYNAHRIHYDRDYAVDEEFYPGLVVHAPLQAILLLDLVSQMQPDRPLRSFRFRAVRPTIAAGSVFVGGTQGEHETTLWSADHARVVGMLASAAFA